MATPPTQAERQNLQDGQGGPRIGSGGPSDLYGRIGVPNLA